MIHDIQDVLRQTGEPDGDRIARWVENARREIAETTLFEIRRIQHVVNTIREHTDTYAWGWNVLRSMGCYWLLMIVEPDRSAVVEARRKSL